MGALRTWGRYLHTPPTHTRTTGQFLGVTMGQFKLTFEVAKSDDDQRMVYGWASVIEDDSGAPVVDRQGDLISLGDLTKAAHEFMVSYREAGDMHRRTRGIGKVVESMVITPELRKLLEMPPGKTGWFIGMRVDDPDVWKRVKKGELRAFSIGGTGTRVPV